MSVAVVFAGLMVLVIRALRRQLLQPLADILNQAVLKVIYVDRGRDVHWRYEAQTVFDAAAADNLFHFIRDVPFPFACVFQRRDIPYNSSSGLLTPSIDRRSTFYRAPFIL